jgi:uncharacterized protein DUF3291
MIASAYHLAQANVARVRAPIGSPKLAEFVALLEPINAIADASPGFVWRLQSDDGDATSISVFDDDELLVNMSVWQSVEQLRAFVFETRHLEVFQRRKEWFHRIAEAHLALWWIPVGHIPSVADAEKRITYLRMNGPTSYAFTLADPFPAGEGHLEER